nr:hypothetical protein [Tanacetum cinerariifolium]
MGITTTSPTPQGAAVVVVPLFDRHHDGAPPWRWWLSCQPQPYHGGGSGWKICCHGCCGGVSGGVSGVEWWCSGGAGCRRAAAVAVGVFSVGVVVVPEV